MLIGFGWLVGVFMSGVIVGVMLLLALVTLFGEI
jgi:hypothetical protein|nr:MAG TPA: hypothetical protein [Caudoviricetes sp.]